VARLDRKLHRIGVVVHAKWKHINFETGTWTIPARKNKMEKGRMKSGREYSLRLPEGLLARLKAQNTRNE
jgi:integrase